MPAEMKELAVTFQGLFNNAGDWEAHAPGCKDLPKLWRERNKLGSPEPDDYDTFTVSSLRELSEKVSVSVVGNLQEAIDETGDPWGGWHPRFMPCARSLRRQLPEEAK